MREKVIIFLKNFIIKEKKLSYKEIDGLIYGLNVLYIFITKSFLIFFVAFLLNLEIELLSLLIFFNFIRFFAGGIHLKNSNFCLIISMFCFITISFLIKYIEYNNLFLLMYMFSFISFLFFSPSDTRKKPIINCKKRNLLKICSLLLCIIFALLCLIIKNKVIIFSMLFSCFFESLLILPITYKLFNESYNNYKYL